MRFLFAACWCGFALMTLGVLGLAGCGVILLTLLIDCLFGCGDVHPVLVEAGLWFTGGLAGVVIGYWVTTSTEKKIEEL